MSSFNNHLSVHKLWIIKCIYRKIQGPKHSEPLYFLNTISNSGVNIRPALKKLMFVSQSREDKKLILWKQLWFKKIIIAVNYFRKMLHRRRLTGFLKCLGFPISQGSKYTTILNVSEFWISEGSE